MTAPIVTETTLPPEPLSRDPFIDDVRAPEDGAPPPAPETRRRRIWD